jgi:hypothetical protein
LELNFLIHSSPAYASRAVVLMNSIKNHHPDAGVLYHEVDNPATVGNYIPSLLKTRFEDALMYLDQGLDNIIIIGADIELYSPLVEIQQLLCENLDIILTPHVNVPNDRMPDIHLTGMINSDFIVFRNTENSRAALKWLLAQPMHDNKHHGIFYDQVWVSMLPCLFNHVHILRHPGYNVAWWNIEQRALRYSSSGSYFNKEKMEGKYTVVQDYSEYLLRFFHFSGFIENSLPKISKYSNVIAVDDVLKICTEYKEKLT